MRKRLLALALCVSAFFVASESYAVGGLDLLKPADVAFGGSPQIVPVDGALEVRFDGVAGAMGSWTFQILGPRGEEGAAVRVAATTGSHRVRLLRPRVRALRGVGPVADGDLRLAVHYRPAAGTTAHGVVLVDRWLRAPRLRVMGDREVLAGTLHAPRVVLTERFACDKGACTEVPAVGAEIVVTLKRDGKDGVESQTSGITELSGSAPLALRIPDVEGAATLEITARFNGVDLTERSEVMVVRKGLVLLTLDKPLYQPGQTIHLRALARATGTGFPISDARALFIVFDAKGNKIAQIKGRTSADGVFAGRVDVAERVNTGRWRIEAHVGSDVSEKTVEVKHYVLPKFKVAIETDRAYWAPGAVVSGTLRADYFFGKPVAGASAELVVFGVDAGTFEVARVQLNLGVDGSSRFSFQLPPTLVAATSTSGATVQLAGRVTDAAGQVEEQKAIITVASEPLRVTAMPEAGRLMPGLPNHIFFVVTRPDGEPVDGASVAVRAGEGVPQSIVCDGRGVAVLPLTPRAGEALTVSATAPDGSHTTATLALQSRAASGPQVLLRPSHHAPRAGTELGLDLFASDDVGFVFVDLVQGGQTLVTLSAPVAGGRAHVAWTIPPELAGTVLVHAWAFGSNQAVVTDTRPIVIQAADKLSFTIVVDKPVWRPGETAHLAVAVTDEAGRPARATIGVQVVDEAVFARSDAQPGLEKVFFLLEQEILRPKVEFHAFDAAEVFMAAPDTSPDRAAAVLSAAAMPSFAHLVSLDSRDGSVAGSETLWRAVFEDYAEDLRRMLTRWVKKVWREPRPVEAERLLAAAGLRGDITQDWFGTPFIVQIAGDEAVTELTLRSAGRDGLWNTPDDLTTDLGLSDALEAVWQWRAKKKLAKGDVGVGGMGFALMGAGGGGFGARGSVGHASKMYSRRAGGVAGTATIASPRLRAWFPETLFVDPALQTDVQGKASLTIPLADSITTWRMSLIASDAAGRLGSHSQGIRVFQDFFVDVAFPNGLTRGDEVTVPVAVYNYLDGEQAVSLKLEAHGGLEVIGETTRRVVLQKDGVVGVEVSLRAKTVGTGRLRVIATGSGMGDAVERTVRIEPDGSPVEQVLSGYVREATTFAMTVPEGSVPGGDSLQIKLYPGSFAVLVDGLENMLRMPSGCFEQTSSSTYPNILVLKYLRDAKKTKPELEAKALGFLLAGWQRLVTFEVQGGGFSWFGNAPANQVLTAYGLMEFADMADVMPIDQAVVSRTRNWLVSKQQSDGSFKPDASFLHQESWGDIQKSSVIITAWVAWSLARTRPQRKNLDGALRKALGYLERNAASATDPYALAYLANAYAEAAADRPRSHEAQMAKSTLARLVKTAKAQEKQLYFPTALRTATYGGSIGADVEVTALAIRAFMRSAEHLDIVGPVLDWLVSNKDGNGNWHTTQATIQALQALVGGLGTATEAVAGEVAVRVNGVDVANIRYAADDFDVVRFVDASSHLRPGENTVEIIPSGGLSLMQQTVAQSYVTWRSRDKKTAGAAFDVAVTWDRTELQRDDIARVAVTVTSNLPTTVAMGMLDLGVPPGFDVLSEDLEDAVARGIIQRFELTGRQIIIYVPEFKPGPSFKLAYRIRARFPLRAASGASRAWEYYDTSNQGVAAPFPVRVQ